MSFYTDLLGTTGPSADAENFYNRIKAFTDEHFGVISGKDNIIAWCNNNYTEEQIISFCHSLEYKPGFRYEECYYHGQPYIQNIWIDIVYDINGNRM